METQRHNTASDVEYADAYVDVADVDVDADEDDEREEMVWVVRKNGKMIERG